MHKKGFTNVILVILIIMLVGALGYLTFIKKSAFVERSQSNNLQNTQTITPSTVDNTLPAFSWADNYQGWYWGNENQKKSGTPTTWLHRYEGTRSSQWYDPSR